MALLILQVVELFIWHGDTDWLEKTYSEDEEGGWRGIIWSGGATSVPTGVPPCGWDGEYCITPTPDVMLPFIIGKCSCLYTDLKFIQLWISSSNVFVFIATIREYK